MHYHVYNPFKINTNVKEHIFLKLIASLLLQIGDECLACRERVAMFDLSYLGKFYLCGPEAQIASDWLFSANTNVETGQSVYSCLLNPQGGVEGEVIVSAIETGTGSQSDPIFKVFTEY